MSSTSGRKRKGRRSGVPARRAAKPPTGGAKGKKRAATRRQPAATGSPRLEDVTIPDLLLEAIEPENWPDSPFFMERIMREVSHSLGGQTFASADEMRAAMQSVVGKDLGARRQSRLQDDPSERAQELAFRAMEAGEATEALALAGEALELNPHCLDALTTRAFLTITQNDELITDLENIVAMGQEDLGPDFFAEHAGELWTVVEARPYLRAIKQLAELLWDTGHRLDAVEWYEDLVDLDLHDHQGNARLLVACYLTMGELARTGDVLEDYGQGDDTFYQWARLLEQVLSGRQGEAGRQLRKARRANPHVEAYLVGREHVPREMSAYYTPGEPSEAVVVAQILGQAWSSHPVAMIWLMESQEPTPDRRRPARKKLH